MSKYPKGSFLSNSNMQRVEMLLGLNDVQKAKMALLRTKEIYDKEVIARPELKNPMYFVYYQYYKHPLVKNVKKSIDNAVGWLSTFNENLSLNCFIVHLVEFTDFCIENRAFKQSEYCLRVAEHYFVKQKYKIVKPQKIELLLMVQKVFHVFKLLLDLAVLAEEKEKKAVKFIGHMKMFDIKEFPEESDPSMDGTIQNPATMLETFLKAKKLMAESEAKYEKIKDSLTDEGDDFIRLKVEFNKVLMIGATGCITLVTFKFPSK